MIYYNRKVNIARRSNEYEFVQESNSLNNTIYFQDLRGKDQMSPAGPVFDWIEHIRHNTLVHYRTVKGHDQHIAVLFKWSAI